MDIFNPVLISIVAVIAVLACAHIDYDVYYSGAQYLSYLLTPATVCLAVPLYEKIELLKEHWKAIVAGILSGVLTTLLCVLAMSLIFGFSHEEYRIFKKTHYLSSPFFSPFSIQSVTYPDTSITKRVDITVIAA